MCKTRTISSKKTLFSLNYQLFCWSPKSPLKVPWRSRTLGPLGDLQGTFMGPSGDISGTSRADWKLHIIRFCIVC